MLKQSFTNCVWLATGLSLWVGPIATSAEETKRADREYLINFWQTEDGLPQSSVTAILQSRDGYLWLGTFNGLARFDGARFQVFDSNTSPELKSSRILGLSEDRDGDLWIRTEPSGLARLRAGRFKDFSTLGQTWKGSSYDMTEDSRGTLWLNTGDNGVLVQPPGEKPLYYNHTNGLPDDHVSALAAVGDQVWIGSKHGLTRFAAGRFERFPNKAGTLDFAVEALQVSFDGGLWVAASGGIQKLKSGKWIARFDNEHGADGIAGEITSMLEDRKGNLWVGSYGAGLHLFAPDGAHLVFNRSNGFSADVIRSLYQDREGNLWVGLDGGGLARLQERAFQVYDTRDGLSENIVLSVCEDNEEGLWIGTNGGGLERWRAGKFIHFGPEQGLNSLHVWSVLAPVGGKVLAGTWGNGAFQLRDQSFVRFPELSTLSNEVVTVLYDDLAGSLWLAKFLGGQPAVGWLEQWRAGRMTRYTAQEGLAYYDVRALVRDRAGNLWIGSNGGGLSRLRDGKFTHWTQRNGLAYDRIWALHGDEDGALWIGTFGGGLCRFKDGKFTSFNISNGPLDKVICSIVEDGRGNLWLSSYKGIFRASKKELNDFAEGKIKSFSAVAYDKGDGLGSIECTGGFQPSSCRLRDGRLCFPTIKGLVVVNPDQLKVNATVPPVVIEAVMADGKIYQPEQKAAAATAANDAEPRIVFPPGRRRVQFQYTGLSFTAPEKVRFKYRLEELDSEWVEADTHRTATYSYVPPGKYRFHVIACNNDNIWNEVGQTLAVTVLPPLWRTWWFITLSALMGMSVLAAIVRVVSVKKLQRQLAGLERQHAVEHERSRIAHDIHDDLGASLTQITLLSELAARDLTRSPEAGGHIRKISVTARELTQAMDEIVWAVNPHNDTLEGLVTYICKFAQDYLGLAGIRCRLELPIELPHVMLSAEERHHFYLACKEALTNIVKHAGASEVWISFSHNTSSFAFTLSDNGRGFDDSAALFGKGGNGLGNIRTRLAEIGGRLELESRPREGTRVKLELKFKTA